MRKVVVVGGSTGGIAALGTLLRDLPVDFPAPILAVIHLGEGGSSLDKVLQKSTKLKVLTPTEAQALAPGEVYMAPPNRHLLVRDGCVLTANGPRENRHRPAVDALFRSAARAYRSNLIAIVLSGALDDGVAGALAVRARGGTIIVQDPKEAQTPDMPVNVLKAIKTNHVLTLAEIPPLLTSLVSNGEPLWESKTEVCDKFDAEENMAITEPMGYTCPECHGTLLRIDNGVSEQFRCNVGHIYSLESFSLAHSHALERALWVALQRLNEQRSIQEHLAQRTTDVPLQRRHQENAAAAAEDMRLLKEILARL